MSIITLLSDFGIEDVYIGVMKGVITQICPVARLIDLTHAVPPQNLLAARFHLMTSCGSFPKGTVHLAVVDPGVGSQRRSIAIQLETRFLVGPDNGIFSGLLQKYPAIAAIELDNPQYWRTPKPSHTFHGRDIFAPAAAHLANGVPLEKLGTPLDLKTLVDLPVQQPERSDSKLFGTIQHVDHFGNLITTLPGEWLQNRPWSVKVQGHTPISGVSTYADVQLGELAAFIGSHGWLEIAVNGASAWERLRSRVGHSVEVQL